MAEPALDTEAPAPDADEAARAERARTERLQLLGARIQSLATKRIGERAEIEQRWLDDLRQYNGQYDVATQKALEEDDTRSRAFVNMTRSKVGTAESRMIEMLFPADERNWAITHTPVPDLEREAHSEEPAGVGPDGQTITAGQRAAALIAQAKQRAEAMQDEIADQLEESRYYAACRDVIHEGVVLGTGVLKGPVTTGRMRRAWRPVTDAQGNTVHVLERVVEHRPATYWVDVWDFYPDMSVTRYADGDGDLERHRMRRAELAQMVNDPGALPDEIKAVLAEDPASFRSTNTWISEMRAISGVSRLNEENHLYEVWEYNGPLTVEELVACGCEDLVRDPDAPDDPLEMYHATLLVAHNRVIRALLHPLDTQDPLYSIWCWEADDTCVFGFGVPYQLRHPQRVLNGAWRMVLENGGLSTGPQVVINRTKIEPADGDHRLRARKIWYTKDGISPADAFATHEVPSHQAELMQIVAKAEEFFDDETALPLIAQGQQAPGSTRTASGMSLLMNSANIQLRRAVKNWDDDITVPTITRFYDWNMQYSKKEEIKGDQEVAARGSSVLLVREVLAQNLMTLLALAGSNPVLATMTKWADAYREVVKAMQIPHESVVMSDDELREAQANAPQQSDPNEMKIELMREQHTAQMADREAERAHDAQMRELDRQAKLIELADKYQLTIEQVRARLEAARMAEQNKRDLFVNERDLRLATGQGI